MMMPGIFGQSLFDDVFTHPFYTDKVETTGLMKTDVKDTDKGYEFIMDLPGVKKENINIERKNGYLIVNVSSDSDGQDVNDLEKYIRRERYTGSCSRRFYIGDRIKDQDISAGFKNGLLQIFVNKADEEEGAEKDTCIAIEG